MKKRIVLLMLCFLLASSVVMFLQPTKALASPTDSMSTAVLPPSIDSEFPDQPYHPEPPVPVTIPLSVKDKLQSIQLMSGISYFNILRDWGLEHSQSGLFAPQQGLLEEPVSTPEDLVVDPASAPAFASAAAASTVIGSSNASADANQDVEPTVIAINKNGTVYYTTAYVKFLGTNNMRNYFATTTDFNTYTRGQLPMPAGYQYSGDPLAAENPYTNGIAPGRIYISGFAFNDNPTGGYGASAITLWRSDNGGISFPQPTIVTSNSATSYFLDKPAITVSWHSEVQSKRV